MNSIFIISFAIRILLTPLIAFASNNYYLYFIILSLLDSIDCNPLVVKLFTKKELEKQTYCSKDYFYSLIDKLLDLSQYVFAFLLLKHFITPRNYQILLLLFFYRLIGVIHYFIYKDSNIFIYFPDFIKEYILLMGIFGSNISFGMIMISLIAKMGYEYLMHGKNIMLYLYKVLFE